MAAKPSLKTAFKAATKALSPAKIRAPAPTATPAGYTVKKQAPATGQRDKRGC